MWHSPNARYNLLVMDMTRTQMEWNVLNAVVYAALKSFSLVFKCWFMQKQYGISALYQLAFVLEHYWMTLHGKLLVSFVTILNSATIHHGVDFTLAFDFDKLVNRAIPRL